MIKDYSLSSGERQISPSIDNIRRDHINRYTCFIDYILNNGFNSSNILDCFCGNGYGTSLISNKIKTEVLGIDGSKDAIHCANENYKTKNTNYIHKLFPFSLELNVYDIIFSIESVEHVDDFVGFLSTLVNSLRPNGVICVSTPNSEVLSLERNPNKFHFRHFSNQYIIELMRDKFNMKLLHHMGQNVYNLNENGTVTSNLAPSDMIVTDNVDSQFSLFVFMAN